MKKENIFIKIKNCIYDMKAILRYVKEGSSKAIIYILILNVFLGLISGIVYAVKITNGLNNFKEEMAEDKYKFDIANGKLDLKAEDIKENVQGITLYVNDSYKLADKDKAKENIKYNNQYVLALQDGILLNISDYNLIGYTFNYSDIIPNGLNNDDVISKIGIISVIVIPLSIIYTIFNSFVDCLIVCVIAALIAKGCIALMGINKKFSDVFYIALYSATLPIIMFVTIPSIFAEFSLLSGMLVGTIVYIVLIARFEKNQEISN